MVLDPAPLGSELWETALARYGLQHQRDSWLCWEAAPPRRRFRAISSLQYPEHLVNEHNAAAAVRVRRVPTLTLATLLQTPAPQPTGQECT